MTDVRTTLRAIPVLILLVASCAGTTAPSASPAPLLVVTPDQAVARVLLAERRLTGIAPHDAAAIGQANWYEVASASGVGAFVVTVRIGWGDCESGCIDEHRWQYAVSPDGAVSPISQTGPAVPDSAWPGVTITGRTGIRGTATAGPTCPVQKNPPDMACAPRPVAGAVVRILDAAGTLVARTTTGADGTFFVDLPTGRYVVEPQAVVSLMGTAGPQTVTVDAGRASAVQLDYDTGIR